jgi:hypothetical protein
VDRHVARAPGRPALELGDLPRVRDDVDAVEPVDLGQPVEDPVDDRPAADREQLLGDGVGQRTEPGRVPGGEDDGFQVPSSQEAR